MTTPTIHKDTEKGTMTVTTEFDAPVERIWRLWSDPRQLERWWGPPTYPATFVDHDLTPGGIVNYYMTGPEGDRSGGQWRIRTVEPLRKLEFEDAFADDHGNINLKLPVTVITVTLEAGSGGETRMSIHSAFPSPDAMREVLDMGLEEGLLESISQIDDLLAEDAA
jgi:uncharacterized protein YndB with AHSA1/START domain